MSSTALPVTQTFAVPQVKPFSDLLSGPDAFYVQDTYEQVTKGELAQRKPLSRVTYTWNTESIALRIVKIALSILIFPIGMYHLLHALAGKIILPSTWTSISKAREKRSTILLNDEWKYKRLTIAVDGYTIDAMIVVKPNTAGNGRWVLSSNGNAQLYETQFATGGDPKFKQILSSVNSNGIVFNYPGVGASSSLPNRQAMAKAYRAMLTFLEDQNKGIGAKEIIGYGFSVGGGVQGDALLSHPLKKGVKYVFVKGQTFSNLSNEASCLYNKVMGFLVRVLGWNIDSVHSSKQLKAPEIILQTARVAPEEQSKQLISCAKELVSKSQDTPEDRKKILEFVSKGAAESRKIIDFIIENIPQETLTLEQLKWFAQLRDCITQVTQPKSLSDSSEIIDDGVIPADASLAKALLDDTTYPKEDKTFIGICETHCISLFPETLTLLALRIKDFLPNR